MSLLTKLEAKTEPELNTGCWLWAGAVSSGGYGVLSDRSQGRTRHFLAHRVSWQERVGEIPPSMFVCHKCDTPACVNPAHLFLGTPKQNTADMIAKGRRVAPSTENRARGGRHWTKTNPAAVRRGNDHPMVKLSDSDVAKIRSSDEQGVVLAKRFGVSNVTVSRIRRRLIWRHV